MITEGHQLENISLMIGKSNFIDLSTPKNKKIIIYFYPKDDTPGCTKEAIAFNTNLKKFEKLGVQIFGISKDSIEKHEKFKNKYSLNLDLVSDDGSICSQFGVWVEKSMYGKKYMGIERSTFLINKNLTVIKIWRKVKVNGHVEEVLDFIINNN